MAHTGSAGSWPPQHPFRRSALAGPAAALFLASVVFATGGPGEARAAVTWPRTSLVLRWSGLAQPVQITHAGDNTGRLFVVGQGGVIRVISGGALLPTPFLDISGRVVSGGEQGLLGLAFPPGYAAKGYFYVNYTRAGDGATVVARYRITANDPNVADSTAEEAILIIPQPAANHNGGQIAFGPDGFLYVGMGDGGGAGDPSNFAQAPAVLLGKMLRIDVESAPDPGLPYAIPLSNPFFASGVYRPEIWALGLRNPWRFAFDRGTGDLYIGDVGQNAREEIDFQPAASPGGENYGWRIMEGTSCFNPPNCSIAGLALPVAEYDHSLGCAVTGGTVYRGSSYQRMQGVYLYGDYCSGRIWGLTRDGAAWTSAILLASGLSITAFGEDEAGNLYVADHGAGAVHEVVAPNAPPAAPALVFPEDGRTGVPRNVTFSWARSTDPDGDPVTYDFYLSTDPSFSGTIPMPVASAVTARAPAASVWGWAFAALLPGAALPALRRRRNGGGAIFLALIFAGLLFGGIGAGCGGGSTASTPAPPGSPPPAPTGPVTHTVSGLLANTAYYWKVVAGDGLGATSSPTRSFTTGP